MKLRILKNENVKLIVKIIYDVILVALIPLISIIYNEVSKDRKLLNDINSILIGESTDYCDDCFGVPIFQKQHDEYGINERVYDNKYVIIRAYFKDSSLIGYFVTSKRDNEKISLPEQFDYLVDEKYLGKFNFTDISGMPYFVGSYHSNGVGHFLYNESYYYASGGNYYFFFFMYMDYGIYNLVFDNDAFESDIEIANADLVYDRNAIQIDRSKSFPNTYGVVSTDIDEIYELISTYYNFNFQGLY